MNRATVSVGRCDFEVEDKIVEEQVSKLIDMIGGLPPQIQNAKRIVVKPNIGYTDTRRHKGRLIAISEPCVTRAVLKRIREVNKKAEIIISEGLSGWLELVEQLGYKEIAKEFNAKIVDCNLPPYVEVEVPGKPLILRKYVLNKEVANADATVSIAKMKVHLFSGVTLCMKNLFGFPPAGIYGTGRYGRTYLHYPFRLPRCIVDLTAIFKPSLCIIEGLIGEELQEWKGQPVENNLIIVGNNAVATDAVGTVTMGFNPESEFPEMPFLYDINHIRLAKETGLGPCDTNKITVVGENPEKVKMLYRKNYACNLPPQLHLETRRYIAQQASCYMKLLPELLSHRGEYVLIGDGEVKNLSPNLGFFDRLFKKYLTYRSKKGTLDFPRLHFIKKIESADKDPEIMEVFTNT
jgi:uncharacterized protein (DUF362 family)